MIVPVAVLAAIAAQDWISAADHRRHAAADPAVHGAGRAPPRGSAWSASSACLQQLSGHFLDVVAGLPTLKVFGRAKAQIRGHRGDHRPLSDGGDGDAAGDIPVLADPRAGRDDLGGAGRRRRRPAADGRSHRPADRADGARARARGLPPAATARRQLPRQRRGHAARPAGVRGAGAAVAATPVTAPTSPTRRSPASPSRISRSLSRARGSRRSTGSRWRSSPGEVLAITGPSGCGKSTLLAVLLGFSRPDADRSAWAMSSSPIWISMPGAAQLSWMPQRPHLFAASIADNIRLGRPEAIARERSGAAVRRPGWATSSRDAAGLGDDARRSRRGSLGRRAPTRRAGACVSARRTAAAARRADGQPRRAPPRKRCWRRSGGCCAGAPCVLVAHRPALVGWPIG